MAVISPPPKLQFFDSSGNPLVGGKLYTYRAGTSTPQATFTDSTAATQNTNPVILDARGECSVWLDGYDTKFVLHDASDALIWTQDHVGENMTQLRADLADSSVGMGSKLIAFIRRVTGAVARWVEDKLSETVSVLDFAGVAGDSATNCNAGLAAAIAHCKLTAERLYWPPGTYLTTTSLPDFHAVQHYGPGIIKRGTDLFYIQPPDSVTNTLYSSSTGSDNNDGLSASQPILTLSKVKVALINVAADSRGGTWRIKFAAGTYTDSTNFTDVPVFRNSLEFIGTGTSRTPATIFDGTGAAYQTAGMYFQNSMRVLLQYIKFQDFPSGYGVYAQWNCKLELYDCSADNCNIGFAAAYSSFIRCERTLANNCGTGYRVAYCSEASFGPGGGGSLSDSARATACGNGFNVTRSSIAHTDYCEAWDCTAAGCVIEINSRSAMLGGDYRRNPVAIRVWSGGWLSLDGSEPLILNQDDPTKRNDATFEYRGGSGETSIRGQAGTTDCSVYKSLTPTTVTGTLTPDQIGGTLFTIPAGWFVSPTRKIRLRAWGTTNTPAGGTIAIYMMAASTTIAAISVPASTVGAFFVDVELRAITSATQKSVSVLVADTAQAVETSTNAIDLLQNDRALTLWADINGDPAGSITFESVELIVAG